MCLGLARCFPLPRIPLLPTGALPRGFGDGDAIGRYRLAGLRNHPSPARSRTGRARAISARHPALPDRGTCGRPVAAQPHRGGLLCGFTLCSILLLAFTVHGLQSVVPSTWCPALNGVVRAFNGPAGQSFCLFSLPKNISQRCRMELVHFSGRHNRWTGSRRPAVWFGSREEVVLDAYAAMASHSRRDCF